MNYSTTQAWLIRTFDYKEADRIGVFLTADFGKMTCFLKGIKKPKSKLGKTISLLNLLEISFEESKGFKFIREAKIIFSLTENKKHELFHLLHFIAEISHKSLEDNEPNLEFFDYLKHYLKFINNSKLDQDFYLIIFLIQVLKILGFGLNFETCQICEEKLKPETNYLDENLSGIVCQSCQKEQHHELSINAQKIIKLALNLDFNVLNNLNSPAKSDIAKLKNLFLKSIYYHLGINLKSAQYLN